MNAPPPAEMPAAPAAPPDRFRCGTLVYTKAGLFTLFCWLLWGDFCFSLMETVWPHILPLLLSAEDAPNIVIGIAMTAIPQAMNFVLNPIISTLSDRHRGRRGRRIPFLLMATPFITLFLILLGFSREFGVLLHGWLGGLHPALTTSTVTIGVICVLITCFRFFELFVNTVFWYLFNDVVPRAFIGRFMGLFRMVGTLAGALFNFFLFKYATSHTSQIFLGVALLYAVAFLLLCFNVREGEYPLPEKISGAGKFAPLEAVKGFFRDCFGHRIFRLVFTGSAATGLNSGISVFTIFMAFSIGLTKDNVGKIAGVAGVLGVLLMYPVGMLVDRFHPLRMLLVAQAAIILVALAQCVFLFVDFSSGAAFWTYAALAGLLVVVNLAQALALVPMNMHVFPKERFGQFCAANAMCGAFGAIAGGVLSGVFLDAMKRVFANGDYYYRFVPVWQAVFVAVALGFNVLVFREWKKLGGDKGYSSPFTDGFERL